jgi:hypothetical protein
VMPVAVAHGPDGGPCTRAVRGSALLYASVGDDQPAPRSRRKKKENRIYMYVSVCKLNLWHEHTERNAKINRREKHPLY